MSYPFYQKAVPLIKAANVAEDAGRLEDALQHYTHALQYLMTGLRYEKSAQLRAVIKGKVSGYLAHAEDVKKRADKYGNNAAGGPAGAAGAPAAAAAKGKGKGKGKGKSAGAAVGGGGNSNGANAVVGPTGYMDPDRERLRKSLEQVVLSEKPDVHWKDVAGLKTAKEQLEVSIVLPKQFPQLFTGKRKPWKGVLLYGPPGTGKTHLARAVATETDCTFLYVSSADLVSKWVGDSERLVRELFRIAEERKPTILFIDEIDSIAQTRSDDEHDATRRLKNEFLVRMQDVLDTDGILVLAATNRPWDLDAAVRRRFERRIYIPLPDYEARLALLKIHFGKERTALRARDLERVAAELDGYTGSDIAVMVRDTLMMPVRRCMGAKHWRRVTDPTPEQLLAAAEARRASAAAGADAEAAAAPAAVAAAVAVAVDVAEPPAADGDLPLYTPCEPGTLGAEQFHMFSLRPQQLVLPPIDVGCLRESMTRVPPSVSRAEVEEQEAWTEQYGIRGDARMLQDLWTELTVEDLDGSDATGHEKKTRPPATNAREPSPFDATSIPPYMHKSELEMFSHSSPTEGRAAPAGGSSGAIQLAGAPDVPTTLPAGTAENPIDVDALGGPDDEPSKRRRGPKEAGGGGGGGGGRRAVPM